MVNENNQGIEDFTKDIKDEIDTLVGLRNKSNERLSSQEGIYFFVSIDMVNSTQFKEREPEIWYLLTDVFYSKVRNLLGDETYEEGENYCVTKSEIAFSLWKYNGDEVLMYRKVKDIGELYKSVLFIYERVEILFDMILDEVKDKYASLSLNRQPIDEVKDKYASLSLNHQPINDWVQKYMQTELGVKSAVWLAACEFKNSNRGFKNKIYDGKKQSHVNNNSKIIDFLGPDMDTGFRLCALSEKNKLLVSANLAYAILLANKSDVDKTMNIDDNFKIMAYKKLKGVWNGAEYPVVLFCQNFEDNFARKLQYNEFISSELCKVLAECGQNEFLQKKEYRIDYLYKIMKDRQLDKEVEDIIDFLKSNNQSSSKDDGIEPNFEFHVACVCYDEETKEIFLEKHSIHGWDFGCARLESNINIRANIARIYKRKFGIEIDSKKIDFDNILTYYKANRVSSEDEIFGIVVMAYVEKKNTSTNIATRRWVSLEEAYSLAESNEKCIDRFEITLKRVEEAVKKRKNEGSEN